MIDPILLGTGKRFFPEEGPPRRLHLSDNQVTATGAIPCDLPARRNTRSLRER
jgi:hypothetical protein